MKNVIESSVNKKSRKALCLYGFFYFKCEMDHT